MISHVMQHIDFVSPYTKVSALAKEILVYHDRASVEVAPDLHPNPNPNPS